MRLIFNEEIARNNLKKIKSNVQGKVAFLIKSQLLFRSISKVLENELIYTTNDKKNAINIYNCKDIVIVDAYEKREGISIKQAKKLKFKDTAIVNFCCCKDKLPTAYEVVSIYNELKEIGFKKVSLGGSLLLNYNIVVDELRVGEAFLTGYSTLYNHYFFGLDNPFLLEIEIDKENEDGYVVNKGFMDIGGFTNTKPICVNTDYSVFNKEVPVRAKKLQLKPDYYTLFKIMERWHKG